MKHRIHKYLIFKNKEINSKFKNYIKGKKLQKIMIVNINRNIFLDFRYHIRRNSSLLFPLLPCAILSTTDDEKP